MRWFKFKLASSPSRPAPEFNPVIEAWLDDLPPPSTQPSSDELRQWRFGNYHGLGRSVFVTCMVLRAVALAIALVVTAIMASLVGGNHGLYYVPERLIPVLVICLIAALWNAAEFVTVCFLRDRGIPPTTHVWVDTLLFMGTATVTSILVVDIICGIVDFAPVFDAAAHEISSACLLIVLMIIHSFLVFFFMCTYLDKKSRRRIVDSPREDTVLAGFRQAPTQTTHQAGSFTSPELLKLGQVVTSMHFNEFDPEASRAASNESEMVAGCYVPQGVADVGPFREAGFPGRAL